MPVSKIILIFANIHISIMTQDEKWLLQYHALTEFIEVNQRRPSKYEPTEKLAHHWWRHNLKLYTRNELPTRRVEKFKALIELANKYKRKNQYK